MNILFVASEAAPFAKTGGLADVAGSLPKELKRLGHDVRIILPFYKTVAEGGFAVSGGTHEIEVRLGGSPEQGVLRQTALDGIPVYLLENDRLFGRDFLYGTPTGDYPDNPRRFAFFCRWVLELLGRLDFRPDILHCHDWQTALVPILIKHEHGDDPLFRNTAVLYTIHNLAYQGVFPPDALTGMGLDRSYLALDRLEYYGGINLMKGAILSADLINTVSESYCREIQTPEQGCGLDGVLRERRGDLSGIVNGLDYSEWDPAGDRELFSSYSAASLEGKRANKKGLQRLLGLEQSAQTPLLGIVSRLSAQKGFDLVARLLPRFAAEGLQLAILGSGEEKFVRLLSGVAGQNAGHVSFNFGFDPALAHKIYAGCDIFLMPSHYEPCGLGQLIALRYGTVPVVRKTGGLADTVLDPRESPEPTGFSFGAYSSHALWGAVRRAILAWRDREGWETMVRRGMGTDFSWRHSALRYEELYRRGIEKRRG
ncbi:MAG: glycogen synthase GlgA [Geobacteraceae bacterium]|nr:glycogen synthase GlgA [Geobacteraceae bacterium]